MRVTFKLYAMLTDHLPQQVDGRPRTGNVVQLDLDDGTTVQQVIDRFALPAPLVHLVLVNGAFVAKEARAGRALVEGDVLAIWPPVGGG
jgi:sulfur carrier protein ThiS